MATGIYSSASTTSINSTTWDAWNYQIYSNTASFTTTSFTLTTATWIAWNELPNYGTQQVYARPALVSPEEQKRRTEAEYQRNLEAVEAQKKRNEEVLQAKQKARKLLVEHLSVIQRGTYEAHGYFDVAIEEKIYRIRQGIAGNIYLLDKEKQVKRYCIHPDGIPEEDCMLAQKLLLEADETTFLRTANVTNLV